jgi:hypothetical protein
MKVRLYLFIIVIILLYALNLTGRLSSGGDDANYIVLAKALASGHGYRLISHPNEPAETQYPPLLPFLLLPVVKFFPQNYLIPKIIPLLFAFASILALSRLLKVYLPQQEAKAQWLLLCAAVSPMVIYYSTQVLSEPLFYFFSLLTLYIALRFEGRENIWILLILAILAAAAYYSRSIGLSLILSLSLLYLIKKRYKSFLIISLFMLALILPWIIRNSLAGGNGYVSSFFLVNPYDLDSGTITFIGFVKRFFMNAIRYSGKVVPDLLFYPWLAKINPYNPFKIALGLLFSFLMALGFYRSIRTRLSILNMYGLIYFLFCLLWPWYDVRFLMPLLPLILLFIVQGIGVVIGFLKKDRLKRLTQKKFLKYALISVIILFFLMGDAYIIYNNREEKMSSEWQEYHKACLWLEYYSDKGSNILCRKPSYTYLISGRKAVLYPFTQDYARMSQFLKDNRIDYIIYDRLVSAVDSSELYLKPFIMRNPALLRPVYKAGNSGTLILKWVGVLE